MKMASAIPSDVLQKSDKILFIAHLALGDFTYLQSCLQALCRSYPHMKIHVWVDELRRTDDPAKWPLLAHYSLYDWLENCPFIEKVYQKTYSPALFEESIIEARNEHYPIVVSLGLLNRPYYARLARRICPNGIVAGQIKRHRFWHLFDTLAYAKLDIKIPNYKRRTSLHISEIYAGWFTYLFGLHLTYEDRYPFLDIPPQWQNSIDTFLASGKFPRERKIVFLNGFSKSDERSLSVERIIGIAERMRASEKWRHCQFVVNVIPEKYNDVVSMIIDKKIDWLRPFTASGNFYQLPAMLKRCSLIVTVETAIMHLANAVGVPVLALMRQTSPEWCPIDKKNSLVLTVKTRKGVVSEIPDAEIIAALDTFAEENTLVHSVVDAGTVAYDKENFSAA